MREHTGTVKVLGTSASTDETWDFGLTATAGETEDDLAPLSLQVGEIQASVPVVKGIAVTQASFDSTSSEDAKAVPAHSLLQYLALRKHPLTLQYSAAGKLSGVAGLPTIQADIDAAMVRSFSRDLDFTASRALYAMVYTEPVQKAVWNQLLVLELPEDFEVGVPWTKQHLTYLQPYYVWIRGTYTAEDHVDGGYTVQVAYEVPAAPQASVKAADQQYLYTVKNGTGTGKYEIDESGQVRRLEQTLHTYFDVVMIAAGQRIPMDQYYSRLKVQIDRE